MQNLAMLTYVAIYRCEANMHSIDSNNQWVSVLYLGVGGVNIQGLQNAPVNF